MCQSIVPYCAYVFQLYNPNALQPKWNRVIIPYVFLRTASSAQRACSLKLAAFSYSKYTFTVW